jgi:hypothetical protein
MIYAHVADVVGSVDETSIVDEDIDLLEIRRKLLEDV